MDTHDHLNDMDLDDINRLGDVEMNNIDDDMENIPHVESMTNMKSNSGYQSLSAVEPKNILTNQQCTYDYDIVDWHLQETIANQEPPQLLMIIPGEGGVGKSKTLQTITENFAAHGVAHVLVKAAYTGIVASTIKGQTIHVIAMIPVNSEHQSAKTLKKLEALWAHKKYLAIDKMSMVSKQLFAKLSRIISRAKGFTNTEQTDLPFGGLNVILLGDFHQFPPVLSQKSAPLYWPCNPSQDSEETLAGRKLYECFKMVVLLKE